MDNEKYIEKYLKDSLHNIIAMNVDAEINKKVQEFQNQLIDRRDQYIAEIMKGIRIMHEQEPLTNTMNYRIVFENIQRIEV